MVPKIGLTGATPRWEARRRPVSLLPTAEWG
jgi:hypothetical protein